MGYFSREAMVWTVFTEPTAHHGVFPATGVNGVVTGQNAPAKDASSTQKSSVWDAAKAEKSREKDDIDAVMDKIIQEDQTKVKKKKRKLADKEAEERIEKARLDKIFRDLGDDGSSLQPPGPKEEPEKRDPEVKKNSMVLDWRSSRAAPIRDREYKDVEEPSSTAGFALAKAHADEAMKVMKE